MNIIKLRSKIFYLAFIFLLINLIYSCSSVKPIKEVDFDGFSQIDKGDSLQMNWRFINAEKVLIDGMEREFTAYDKVSVLPLENTHYKFRVIGEEDTLNLTWRIYVSEPEVVEEVKEVSRNDYSASYIESKYFRGMSNEGSSNKPKRLKVMRNIYKKTDAKSRVIVLDKYGNYMPNLGNGKNLNWASLQHCANGVVGNPIMKYTEVMKSGQNISLGVVLDNSAAAEYNLMAMETIKSHIENMNSEDNFIFTYFNQNAFTHIPYTKVKNIQDNISELKLPDANGINAIYKSAYKTLSAMKSNMDDYRKALVILTFSSNNAATIYNPKDVIDLARELDIPVYIVSVGDGIDSYSLRYISDAGGGRYYNLDPDDLSLFGDILNEITFSMNSYYELSIDPSSFEQEECEKLKSEMSLNIGGNNINDIFDYIPEPMWTSSRHETLVAFDYKRTRVSEDYKELCESLARVLKDNPSYNIELIGHSSIEGNSEANIKISERRAENVKKFLVSNGVVAERIKTKGEGANMPIYYLPQSPWQQFYNRRVEVRWLIPEMMPYEIVAEQLWTEEDAEDFVNEWRRRGYRSYYQRYLVNNKPVYRVKLWGYESLKSAQSEAMAISKEFKVKLEVE